MKKKVMVVDDDPAQVRLMDKVLTQSGYDVLKAYDGLEAIRLVSEQKPDMVLLDVVMPGIDGWLTCSRIREFTDIPVIMLTGQKSAEDDIVRGLDYGADEYLLKPVGNRELVARVGAAFRREKQSYKQGKSVFNDDYLSINIAERRVAVKGKRIKLTPREFRILALLVENIGHIVTHQQVLQNVWGWEYIDDIDYVRIYISHLRQKIEQVSSHPRYILNEPGMGYYFYHLD
jgi:DNA-binding response OmpR family regulator